MTDPLDGLNSFQEALSSGQISLQRGTTDPDLYVYADTANGEPRLTYDRLIGRKISAFANATLAPPYNGKPCLGIGYAVPPEYRNQGRATEVVQAALVEMQEGLKRSGIPKFYVEAVVAEGNLPSQRVAEKAISNSPIRGIDEVSGLPAMQYIREMGDD
jgi:hypothetical protein